MNRRHYNGPALESGGTSISGKATPHIKSFLGGMLEPGMKVLDYGSGKMARNANYLRDNGIETFAYDPFHGSETDGWNGTAGVRPSGIAFDVAFTSYVLNVVPYDEERKIVKACKTFASKTAHITRGTDVFDSIRNAINRGDKTVMNFFEREFAPGHPTAMAELDTGEISDQTVEDLCCFGVATSRGFQRIPHLEGFSRRGSGSSVLWMS